MTRLWCVIFGVEGSGDRAKKAATDGDQEDQRDFEAPPHKPANPAIANSSRFLLFGGEHAYHGRFAFPRRR
jgi:hypothetical protein